MAATWTEQREKVFTDRYARKDSEGKLLESKPHETWDRVARAISKTSREYDEFYELLRDWKFVPGGRILTGAGTDTEVTFYNCYVIPIRNTTKPENGRDSREAIFDTISQMVNIMSRGGGVGINWSTLRPNGAYLSRINGTTTGPLEWMDVASKAVGAVMQGGSRRGAAMFMLDDWHPDIEAFIDAKRDLTKITNANISVAVSDTFMQAVKDNAEWYLGFPDTTDPHYNAEWDGDANAWLEKGYGWNHYKSVMARDIWRKLAEGAWDNGEPGVIFLERYNKLSTAASIEKIICVNPCGEQGLGENSVCNLGAMNLDAYVADRKFDFHSFQHDVATAVRFLDNVIDENNYGDFVETKQQQMKLRRMGLGVMGLADALIHMGLRYGSGEAVQFVEDYGRVMKETAIEASANLAAERGPAEGWSVEMIDRPFFKGILRETREKITLHGMRNLFLLTQAPTGTTSIVAGVSSGIEPHFAFRLGRNDRTGSWAFTAPVLQEWEDNHPGEPLPEYYVESNDISVEEHILMQAAVQGYIDSSVSKTLNAPNSHTVADVEKAYTMAYDHGLKSLAYFRDGCGRAQVLEKTDVKAETVPVAATNGSSHPPFKRPARLTGVTSRVDTAVGTAFVTVNYNEEHQPVEVFINVGKAGSHLQELSEAIGRLISVALQKGVKPSNIVGQMLGIGGYSKLFKSLPTAIALTLQDIMLSADDSPQAEVVPTSNRVGSLCPNCQAFTLLHIEGCLKCAQCEYSAC